MIVHSLIFVSSEDFNIVWVRSCFTSTVHYTSGPLRHLYVSIDIVDIRKKKSVKLSGPISFNQMLQCSTTM